MDRGPPRTPPHYDDFTEPEDGPQNDAMASGAWLLDTLVSAAERSPLWVIDDDSDRTVEVRVISHDTRQASVIALVLGTAEIRLELALDPSGYVRATAQLGGAELFRGYADRPYEELDIWPAGAAFPPRRPEDAPGRMGKRITWLVLDSKTWPALAPLANEAGFMLARTPD